MNLENLQQTDIIDMLSQESLGKILKALEPDPHLLQDILNLQKYYPHELRAIDETFVLIGTAAARSQLERFMHDHQIKAFCPDLPPNYKSDQDNNILPRFLSG